MAFFCPLLGTSPLLTLQSVEPRPFFQVLCAVKRPTLYCLLALLALLTPLCFGQLKSCYYDVGSPANDFPCDPAANVSICCGGSYYCAEDFYCINRVGSWGVGSCTDKRWQDPACPLPLDHGGFFNFTLNTTNCLDLPESGQSDLLFQWTRSSGGKTSKQRTSTNRGRPSKQLSQC